MFQQHEDEMDVNDVSRYDADSDDEFMDNIKVKTRTKNTHLPGQSEPRQFVSMQVSPSSVASILIAEILEGQESL